MKQIIFILFISLITITSCTSDPGKKATADKQLESPGLKGTWKLVSGTKVAKGLTTFTDYTKDQQMIKIINDTHFAFLKHNLQPDADGKNNFDAGGGRYELSGNVYTEHLDYYNNRNWEGKAFNFKVTIKNDTLIQTGIEKIESEGIDQTITEKYVKVK
jgi:lipopolysaccharide export system protein LptA